MLAGVLLVRVCGGASSNGHAQVAPCEPVLLWLRLVCGWPAASLLPIEFALPPDEAGPREPAQQEAGGRERPKVGARLQTCHSSGSHPPGCRFGRPPCSARCSAAAKSGAFSAAGSSPPKGSTHPSVSKGAAESLGPVQPSRAGPEPSGGRCSGPDASQSASLDTSAARAKGPRSAGRAQAAQRAPLLVPESPSSWAWSVI